MKMAISSRRLSAFAVAVFLCVIFFLGFKIRTQQEIASSTERMAQQMFLFGRPTDSPPAATQEETQPVAAEDGGKSPSGTPSPVDFAVENRRHFVGAPQAKSTPLCMADGENDLDDVNYVRNGSRARRKNGKARQHRWATRLVRASPFKHSPMCYYTACNFCITDGALEFFAPKSGAVVLSDLLTHAPTEAPSAVGDESTPAPAFAKKNRKPGPKKRAPLPGTKDTATPHDTGLRSRAEVSDLPPLRLCNELRAKISLPVVDSEALRRKNQRLHEGSGGAAVTPNSANAAILREIGFLQEPPRPSEWIEKRSAHIVACWNFYGFHLFQCSVAAFYAEILFNDELQRQRSNYSASGSSQAPAAPVFDLWLYNHAVTLQRSLREHFSHAMYLGSGRSWTGPQRERPDPALLTEQEQADENAVRPAPWWGMWAVNALSSSSSSSSSSPSLNRSTFSTSLPPAAVVESPSSRVQELFRYPRRGTRTKRRQCYRRGIIGQPVHRVVPHEVRHKHIEILRGAFNVTEPIHLGFPEDSQRPDFRKDAACVAPNHTTVAEPVPIRILICQRGTGKRQGSRRIQNVEHVVNAVEAVFRGQGHLFATNQDETGGGAAARHHHRAVHGNEDAIDEIDDDKNSKNGKTGSKAAKTKNQKLADRVNPAAPAAVGGAVSAAATTRRPVEEIVDEHLTEKLSALDLVSQRLIARTKLEVEVVDFGALPFDEQVRLASRTDVMIATHGAGNVWLSFMPRGRSVFVELWPQYLARDVYRAMAMQYDVKYVPLFAGMKPLFGAAGTREAAHSFLHQDVRVPIDKFAKLLQTDVAPFVLRASKCSKV